MLAGYLHETEVTGELMERVRATALQLDRIRPRISETHESEFADLQGELQELQNEIKKLYRRHSR